jgi:two-component system sensor histidine kinase UhpB
MMSRIVCVDGREDRLTGTDCDQRTARRVVARVAGWCVDRDHASGVSARTPGMSLFWRVFVLNAAVFVIGTAVLALSPAPVRVPVTVVEAILLAVGLLAILLVNLFLLRRSLGPLERLASAMRGVDILGPRQRLPVSGPAELRELVVVFNEMLDRLEHERRESGRRALAAQEVERKRIARELHDEIGQSLTAIVLMLKRIADESPAELRPELLEAQETARQSLDDVRQIAQQLRPEALDDLGLVSALAALTARFGEQTGIEVSRTIGPGLPRLSDDEELVIYRVAQESLTNVARHADASHVDMRLQRTDRGVALCVLDDGIGMTRWDSSGDGVRGMRERALAVGAALTIADVAGGGVKVVLDLPVGERP